MDVFCHIVKDILLLDNADINLVKAKIIKTYHKLKDIRISTLDTWFKKGDIQEGDCQELTLFKMYLKVYTPDVDKIMQLDLDNWLAVDVENLSLKFNTLTTTVLVTPASTLPPPGIPPPFPTPIVLTPSTVTQFICWASPWLADKAGISIFYNALSS